METIHAIGRRKTAVARIYVSEGNGDIIINKRPANEYFTTPSLQYKIQQPLKITDTAAKYNIKVNVFGGGITGQAEAIRMAIARALVIIDADNNTDEDGNNDGFKAALKDEGLLTRDARMVERKKFGQKKARKKFQFSKR